MEESAQLFFANLQLIVAHEADILRCDEYFFCRPEFSTYGISCFSSYINVGTLLLGWRKGILIEPCRLVAGARKAKYSCSGRAYVFRFGGLASGTGWTGFCPTCGGSGRRMDGCRTMERVRFVGAINDTYKDWAEGLELEYFPSQKFSFGEPSIVPSPSARMKRTKLPLVAAVSVEQLIEELQSGRIRKPTGPQLVGCAGNFAH